MGDRTKIADALDDSAATIRGVGMWQERNGDVMSTLPSIADLMERAAGLLRADPDTSDGEMPEAFSVVLDELIAVEPDDGFSREDVARAIVGMLQVAGLLTGGRADPDTSDERKPCPHCNDEGMVCTLDGDIIGPCDCTSDELFAEARRLLDRWDALDLSDIVDDARPLIAALLERAVTAEADLRTLSTRTTGDSKTDLRMLYAYEAGVMEGDAERAARERAEAEARQLREQDAALVEANRSLGADLERLREAIKTIAWTIDPEDGMTDPALIVVHMEAGALEDLRAAIAAAVAEGAEDRAKFPGLHDRPDTGKECHYLAVTMPHGGLFCNKCGWAEGAEDRGQTTTPDGSDE